MSLYFNALNMFKSLDEMVDTSSARTVGQGKMLGRIVAVSLVGRSLSD